MKRGLRTNVRAAGARKIAKRLPRSMPSSRTTACWRAGYAFGVDYLTTPDTQHGRWRGDVILSFRKQRAAGPP
jgi:hypothetical protein